MSPIWKLAKRFKSNVNNFIFQDQDQVRIPEETELNNSKLTVNSANSSSGTIEDNQTKQANGNGKSIKDEQNDKDDATWFLIATKTKQNIRKTKSISKWTIKKEEKIKRKINE